MLTGEPFPLVFFFVMPAEVPISDVFITLRTCTDFWHFSQNKILLLSILEENAMQACRDHQVLLTMLRELEDAQYLKEIEWCNNYCDYYTNQKEVTQHKAIMETKRTSLQERITIEEEQKRKRNKVAGYRGMPQLLKGGLPRKIDLREILMEEHKPTGVVTHSITRHLSVLKEIYRHTMNHENMTFIRIGIPDNKKRKKSMKL